MPRPAAPTPRPALNPIPPEPAPADRLLLLALGGTTVWVLAWVVIQLGGLR